MISAKSVAEHLTLVRQVSPLVHNITNYVVMNWTANGLLALGASPVMAHAPEEVEEIVGICQALVINIGTLSAPWIASMRLAMRAAAQRGIPIILDPVGAGASQLRTAVARELAWDYKPTIIRGNASEIAAVAGHGGATKGVDSTADSRASCGIAQGLADRLGCVVSMSGATDVITDGKETLLVHNGVPLMTRVTGMGCLATAVTGAFAAATGRDNTLLAAAHAMACMGIAGEVASAGAQGPGTFATLFLDALAALPLTTLAHHLKVEGSH